MECVDLFCGAGGLTTGLERAGWSTVTAVDIDPDCIATLTVNRERRVPVPHQRGRFYLDRANLLNADIRDLRAADLRPAGARRGWRPDLLVGGPPCQPFSSAGRQRGVEDPRGRLFLDFVRVAADLRPRLILFENVAGIVTAKDAAGEPGAVLRSIQRAFEEIGYACRAALLNAADYGAPQRRVRLFILASSAGSPPEFPVPTHSRLGRTTLFESVSPWVSLREFLAGRPEPSRREIVRPTASLAAQLAELTPGTGVRATGIVEANRPGGHWGYRQDRFLADPALPTRTIRAATTPDWIRLRGGTFRRLTLTECADLQGFPEGWVFQGTAASRFRQVGNAIQGAVAAALGRSLADAAQRNVRRREESAPWPPEFHKRIRYTAAEHAVNGQHRAAARRGR